MRRKINIFDKYNVFLLIVKIFFFFFSFEMLNLHSVNLFIDKQKCVFARRNSAMILLKQMNLLPLIALFVSFIILKYLDKQYYKYL